MSGFETDLAKLTAGATDFGAFAERAGTIFGDLGGVLDSFGACWGSDAIGQSFATSHVQPSTDALTTLGDLSREFGGIGERLTETARTYRAAEDGTATSFGAI